MYETDPDIIRTLKCVFIGSEEVGKTSLIVSYTTQGYPTKYVPTTFDNYSVVVNVDKKPIRIQLCDTAGQHKFDGIRPLSYPDCNVFIVVYSVINRRSFDEVMNRWMPEISKVSPNIPVILVGTQSDRRGWDYNISDCISTSRGKQLANQIRAVEFYECSALTQENLKQMFDSVILAGLEEQKTFGKRPQTSKLKQGFQRLIHMTRRLM
ncbi:unnamed protein product [Auanema sp. JU1783]|nr:unnamed protein product [Auanema sp. JU1783]